MSHPPPPYISRNDRCSRHQRYWQGFGAALCFGSITLLCACGSDVIVTRLNSSGVGGQNGAGGQNGVGGQDGVGGHGGAPASTSTMGATTTTASSTSVTSVGSAATGSTSSTGPEPDVCTGDCSYCQGCAYSGPCADEDNACNSNPDCVALINCNGDCLGLGQQCYQKCLDAYPGAHDVYFATIHCVCLQCLTECGGVPGMVCP